MPKDSAEDLPQELDLAPEPVAEPEVEEATPEQLAMVEQLEKQIEELESRQEPETPLSPRGSLPKDSAEDLPQELDLAPEPVAELLSQLTNLQQQIDDLENISSTNRNIPEDVSIKHTPEINKSETQADTELEQKIIHALHVQNRKLDDIEKKLRKSI